MRTITLLCATALCTLPNIRNLNARPFDPQDSPIVVADGTYPLESQGSGGQGKKENVTKKGPADTKTDTVRTIYHEDGLPSVIPGTTSTPALYRVNDPSGQSAPVCLELSHSRCPGSNCDPYYADVYGKPWSLALNDGISIGWNTILKTVFVITGPNSTSPDTAKIVDPHVFTSATLTVNGGEPKTFRVDEHGKFTIHFCRNNKDCTGGDHQDRCKHHQ
jgi:hypothetical protein